MCSCYTVRMHWRRRTTGWSMDVSELICRTPNIRGICRSYRTHKKENSSKSRNQKRWLIYPKELYINIQRGALISLNKWLMFSSQWIHLPSHFSSYENDRYIINSWGVDVFNYSNNLLDSCPYLCNTYDRLTGGTPSVPIKYVILDKIWVKCLEHKSWITSKLLGLKI
jgi:hypothetical protein